MSSKLNAASSKYEPFSLFGIDDSNQDSTANNYGKRWNFNSAKYDLKLNSNDVFDAFAMMIWTLFIAAFATESFSVLKDKSSSDGNRLFTLKHDLKGHSGAVYVGTIENDNFIQF